MGWQPNRLAAPVVIESRERISKESSAIRTQSTWLYCRRTAEWRRARPGDRQKERPRVFQPSGFMKHS